MAENKKVKVFNDSGYTFHLNVPNSSKTYKVGPCVLDKPGMASIPYSDIEEILASDGGRELLTKRLRFEEAEKIIEDLGINEDELPMSNDDILKELRTVKYDSLRKFLENADPGTLERVPKLIADNKIVDVNILKIVEEIIGVQLVNRIDEVDITKPAKDKE